MTKCDLCPESEMINGKLRCPWATCLLYDGHPVYDKILKAIGRCENK